MLKTMVPVLGVGLILLSDLVHGWVFDREGQSEALRDASARLQRIPLEVGSWRGEELETEPREMERAEVTGWISRRYIHRTSGEAVHLLIVCGPAGPVSVHPPTVCFRGQGYELRADEQQHRIRAPGVSAPAVVWAGDFRREDAARSGDLRTFWTWCDERAVWHAAENPRLEFAGSPFLYKMYVVRSGADSSDSLKEDRCSRFLQDMLPEIQKALFPPAPG